MCLCELALIRDQNSSFAGSETVQNMAAFDAVGSILCYRILSSYGDFHRLGYNAMYSR